MYILSHTHYFEVAISRQAVRPLRIALQPSLPSAPLDALPYFRQCSEVSALACRGILRRFRVEYEQRARLPQHTKGGSSSFFFPLFACLSYGFCLRSSCTLCLLLYLFLFTPARVSCLSTFPFCAFPAPPPLPSCFFLAEYVIIQWVRVYICSFLPGHPSSTCFIFYLCASCVILFVAGGTFSRCSTSALYIRIV